MNTVLTNPARRRLLSAAGVGLIISFATGCALPAIPKRPAPDADDAAGWLSHAQGRYTLWLPRVEMGQNIAAALKQIACEELRVGWNELDLQLPATANISRVRATVGSESVRDFALPLARACATLREAVAAGRSHGELTAREWPAAELRSLNGQGRRHIGNTPRLEQGEAIVRGAPLYVSDVRRPNQLYGRVLRAPASPELLSRLAGADEAAARAVSGFVALVRDARWLQGNAEGIGIVARTPGALDRIEAALAAKWSVDGVFEQTQIDAAIDIDLRLADSPRRDKQLQDQRIDTSAPWDVDLRIDIPLAAHSAIEPRAAVAEFDADGRLQLWVGTQDVFYQRDVVAKRLGLDQDRVIVHGLRVGCAFGGKTICTVELEAALLARAVKAPVKVQWTRAQEFGQAFHRPPSSHRIRVRLHDGRLGDWWHAFASSHIIFTSAGFPPWMQRLADVMGDRGVARGAEPPYRIRARRIGFDAVRLPVHTGPWRGLGAGPNVFAIECAIDECARAAGIDALAFRLAHIDDSRLARVLQRVADVAAWPQRPTSDGTLQRGRGIACGIYKATSYAAVVAEVEVDTADATVKVTRLWCAHDCGLVINPDQVRAQCEGNLVWGMGMVLVEQLPVAGSRIAAASFAESPLVRASQVPAMQVELVDDGSAPSGAGETAIVAAGAAIANALRDACGLRMQRLPLQQAELRAVLERTK
jgi:isoquinoline 1-oxidoreductase beta subunit